MSSDKPLFNFLSTLLLTPIALPLVVIMRFTRGKEMNSEDYSEFINHFIDSMDSYIKEFTGVTSYPTIKMSDNTFTIMIAEFRAINKATVLFPNIIDNVHNVSNIRHGVDIYHNAEVSIMLYTKNISTSLIGHNILTKLYIVLSLIHELVHYRQFINNPSVFNEYQGPKDDLSVYSSQSVEVEATEKSRDFMIKYFSKIIKIIMKRGN